MTIFKLPDLGEGLPDAEIREWYVSEGDEVKLDQPLVSMETAKAVVDVPSPVTGHIVKLYGKPGDIIPTGAPLIGFAETLTSAKSLSNADSGTVVGFIETSDTVLQESPTGIDVKTALRPAIKAIPAVRALANKLQIDLSTVTGTGAGGAITADDVNRAATTPQSAPAGESLHGVKRIMALQMAKSHAEVVPATLMEDADIQHWPEKTDVSIRLIQAVIKACQVEPSLNAHFYGQSVSRQLWQDINIGIAVDTPSGLYVPVIKDAAQQSPENLRAILNSFKSKAAAQSFTPEELQNPTITLSNFGTIAGRYASPVVMAPTVAIIGIGKTRQQVVAVASAVVIHAIMPVSLTFDHRAVTGGEAARFMAAFIEDLERKG